MNIVIYDTEHFETTYTLIRIFDLPRNRVTIFTTEKTSALLRQMLGEKAGNYSWMIGNKRSYRFAFDLYRYCKRKKASHLFLNTVSHHHIFFSVLCFLLKQTESILTVHDANNFFNPRIRFSLRSVIQLVGKKSLAAAVTAYSTLLTSTKQYIAREYKPPKNVYVFPGGIYEPQKKNLNKGHDQQILKLAVCGSIDQYRREYEQFFELASQLEEKKVKCQMILLGAAVDGFGKSVIDRCQSIKHEFINIIFYTTAFVNENEYEEQLNNCDFTFQPLKKILQKPGERPEEYGLTVCSGGFFDAIRFAKPIIIPHYIYISGELAQQCIRYSSIEELAALLSGLTASQKANYSETALNNSLNFTVDSIRLTSRLD